MKKIPTIQTAHAVLLLSGKYLLQLRDNKPTIAAPGEWSLFGGKLQKGETPLQAVHREIFEELNINPSDYVPLWHEDYYVDIEKTIVRTWFFEADVTSIWVRHRLNEGQDVKSFPFNELFKLQIPEVMRKVIERHYNGNKF